MIEAVEFMREILGQRAWDALRGEEVDAGHRGGGFAGMFLIDHEALLPVTAGGSIMVLLGMLLFLVIRAWRSGRDEAV